VICEFFGIFAVFFGFSCMILVN